MGYSITLQFPSQALPIRPISWGSATEFALAGRSSIRVSTRSERDLQYTPAQAIGLSKIGSETVAVWALQKALIRTLSGTANL